jgi:hypothetical protein
MEIYARIFWELNNKLVSIQLSRKFFNIFPPCARFYCFRSLLFVLQQQKVGMFAQLIDSYGAGAFKILLHRHKFKCTNVWVENAVK